VSDSFWSVHPLIAEAEARARKLHLTSLRARLRLQDRIARVEEDLLRANLVIAALADVCVEKGLATADELAARIARHSDARVAQSASPPAAKPRKRTVRNRHAVQQPRGRRM
jgi:hypothetical protein